MVFGYPAETFCLCRGTSTGFAAANPSETTEAVLTLTDISHINFGWTFFGSPPQRMVYLINPPTKEQGFFLVV